MTKTFRFNNLEGTVKYIGPAKGKDGSWIGVELVVSKLNLLNLHNKGP